MIENVAQMLDIARLELCFGVGEPEGHTPGIHVEGAFKDRASACKLILRGFPASCNMAAWDGHGAAVGPEKPCEEWSGGKRRAVTALT
jgi:hypothetical protein